MPKRAKPKPTTSTQQPPPKSRKRRRAIIIGFLLLLTIPIGTIALTRTPLLKSIALSSIEDALGCEATARAVRLSANGTLTFEQLQLSNPNLDSAAAVFFYAERLDVRPEWTSLTGNAVRFQRVQITDPIITLSIDKQNRLNLEGFTPPTGGGTTTAAYPDVTFNNATVQFAEHGSGTFQSLANFNMQGRLLADKRTPRIHTLALEQINLPPDQARTTLTGTLDSRSCAIDLTLANADIHHWPRNPPPHHYQPPSPRTTAPGRHKHS